MRIIFVRHGEPDYTHDCLTETGRRQAKDAALRLRDEGIEAVYSSPFGRAKETAQCTADLLGLPVRIVDFMLERKLNKARLQIQMHKVIWDPNERGV